ncbi:MAG: DsrH/TusB family sulfur relay protein [Methylotenera sp.]|nr:DsrH/TusB family sulfur relay protein [Methylotenera sp.]
MFNACNENVGYIPFSKNLFVQKSHFIQWGLIKVKLCCSLALLIFGFTQSAHATPSSYSHLNADQQAMWQRLLLQNNPNLLPQNADYYLSNSVRPNLAQEFDLVAQYLHGTLPYAGEPDAAPWCRFPARFAFVSRTLDDKLIAPEAFRPCNIALPAIDANLQASLVKVLAPQDTGQALFHMALLVEGKRFYNYGSMSINIGFGQYRSENSRLAQSFQENEALMLLNAFSSDGRVTVKQNFIPSSSQQKAAGNQIYRVNMQPEQIYMLSLLAYESKYAKLPYSLLKANCHTYLQAIFSAVLPESSTQKRVFFDYFPAYMQVENEVYAKSNMLLFEPSQYLALPSTQLKQLASTLNWQEYQILRDFLEQGELPKGFEAEKHTTSLREGIVKAAELFTFKLKKSPQLLAMRDDYLAQIEGEMPAKTLTEPSNNPQQVPIFNSSTPSAMRISAADYDGSGRLNLGFDVFNTTANDLPAAKPYGFILGRLNIQAFDNGLAFDHFLFAQENKVGYGCCGESLYKMGFRKLSGLALNIVNTPEHILVPDWKLKPQIELSMTKGIGTLNQQGFSVQILPEASLLSYDEFVDLTVNNKVSWGSENFAISASRLVRLVGPDVRRSRPKQTLSLNYKLSENSHLAFGYQSYGGNRDIVEAGYVLAF